MKPSEREHRLVPLGALGLSAGILAIALRSWRAWGDPVVDFPQQIYLAWRVSAGELPYRDFPLVYGPFAQLWNGLLFHIFGVSYLTLTMANLILAVLTVLLLYFTLARAFDAVAAALAGAAFVMIHVFQNMSPYSSYSFLAPYSHESTIGVCLILAMVASLSRPRPALLGLGLGAAFLLKPEIFAAAAAVCACSALAAWRAGELSRGWALRAGVGALLPMLAMAVYFTARTGSPVLGVHAVFGAFAPLFGTNMLANPLYGVMMGTDDLPGNLARIARALAVIAAAGAGAIGLERLGSRGAALAYATAAGALGFFARGLDLGAAWTSLSLFGLVWALVRFRKGEVSAMLPALGAAAVLLSARVFFHPVFSWLGFYALAPTTIFLAVLGAHELPKLCAAWPGKGFTLRWCAVALLGGIALQCAGLSGRVYDLKTLRIGEGSDAFYVFEKTGAPGIAPPALVHQVWLEVGKRAEKNATLLTIPDGILINYLLRMPNPTTLLHAFGERPLFEAEGGTSGVIGELERKRPRYVLYLHREPELFDATYRIRGPQGFANEALDWVENHYRPLFRIGPASQDFAQLGALFFRWQD